MKRLPFLDWTRGLAVLIMIQCHAFNSFTRVDLRDNAGYVLSQFVGGMAAVMFLFLAGITFAFQMEGTARREPSTGRRMLAALRRGGYLLGIAYLFRFSNWAFSFGTTTWRELLKVDILNCMGMGMILLAPLAAAGSRRRIYTAACIGLAVAAAAPLVSAIPWGGTPGPVKEYLAPNRARFPLFPWTAYLAFGLAAGGVLKRIAADRLERTLQWGVLAGFGLISSAQYFANIPYSLYSKSDFWTDSPALVLIRVGLTLVALGIAYLWTEYGVGEGWSWIQAIGKTSLMVYWVHIVIVYGGPTKPLRRALDLPGTALATAVVIGLMVALSAARLWWKEKSNRETALSAAAASL